MGKKYEAPFPHCDSRVLHAPGECMYCDDYPEQQQDRVVKKINFTGHYDSDKEMCPAEIERPSCVINAWHGNIPMTPELMQAQKEYWEKTIAELKNDDDKKDNRS